MRSHIISLMTIGMLICLGCSTRHLDSAMIQYIPEDHMRKRTEKELLAEINKRLPFEVDEDNFLANHSVEGHSCWLILKDMNDADTATAAIKNAKDYKFITVGYFDPKYRAIFGFKPIPGLNTDDKK